jgi:hypothetical protein
MRQRRGQVLYASLVDLAKSLSGWADSFAGGFCEGIGGQLL